MLNIGQMDRRIRVLQPDGTEVAAAWAERKYIPDGVTFTVHFSSNLERGQIVVIGGDRHLVKDVREIGRRAGLILVCEKANQSKPQVEMSQGIKGEHTE